MFVVHLDRGRRDSVSRGRKPVQADVLDILSREWLFTKFWDDNIFMREVGPFLVIAILSVLEEILENCAEGRPLEINTILWGLDRKWIKIIIMRNQDNGHVPLQVKTSPYALKEEEDISLEDTITQLASYLYGLAIY